MSQTRIETLWSNQTGVTLSNAGNIFLEAGGNARTSWVPAGTWGAGTHVTTEAGAAFTNAVDTFRGWPSWRREHTFTVPVKNADRLIFEWRGEVVGDATGFANNAALPANQTRLWWGSTTRCHAAGSFVADAADADGDYMWEPPIICYNQNQKGNNAQVFAGGSQATGPEPVIAASGFALYTRNLTAIQRIDPNTGLGDATANSELRHVLPMTGMQKVPFDVGSGGSSPIGNCGLLWGFTANGTGGASRFPKDKDRLGWMIEVGYADTVMWGVLGAMNAATPSGVAVPLRLRTSGLKYVWVTFIENAPPTGAASPYLDFTTASMVVKGKIKVVYMYDTPRSF